MLRKRLREAGVSRDEFESVRNRRGEGRGELGLELEWEVGGAALRCILPVCIDVYLKWSSGL